MPVKTIRCLLCFALLGSTLAAQCPVPTFERLSGDSASVVLAVDSLTLQGPADELLLTLTWEPGTGNGQESFDTTVTEFTDGISWEGLLPATRYSLTGRARCGTDTTAAGEALVFSTLANSPPPNDRRVNAIDLVPELEACGTYTGTTYLATGEANDEWGTLAEEEDVWYAFKFSGPFNSITISKSNRNSPDIKVHYYSEQTQQGDSIRIDIGTVRLFPSTRNWSNLEDSIYLRIYSADPDRHAEFEICVTEQDFYIAEGEGCTEVEPVSFDGTGSIYDYIDIRTPSGIVASISNNQALGEVRVSYYDYDGPPREDEASGAVYLNRNISIVPQNQPTDSVRVRLYLSADDLSSILDTGVISEDNLLAISKVPSTVCSGTYPGNGEPVSVRTYGTYGLGGVIELEVTSFSEFFIHPADQALSTGTREKRAVAAPWQLAPNPAHERIQLTTPSSLIGQAVHAEVYAADGRRLFAASLRAAPRHFIDTGDWPAGVYTVVLRSGETRTALRMVK
ncbi:T9SS type A sorting domain-containing protein [Lewinella sp. IMCC34191]|uniref:T9SS type A sorting domain-containing protein n=1 Tax=Lewinella sp. IMCC34191 TaxID=2259172 RepID=UPI000E28153C|nr:T9SS type A sorting domain-containing protein [Lewinella sp. IMCC34191]